MLFHNKRDGTFEDVTARSRLEPVTAKPWSISAAWLDYNNDGLLDLFVVNYCKWDGGKEPYCGESKPGYRTYCHPKHYEGLPNQLFRNNGDGTFTDVSAASGIAAHTGKGMGIAIADYDADGRIDVFVANDTVRNFLFHNEGGTFTEAGIAAAIAFNTDGRALSSMGVDFRDIDNDGRPDLFVTALTVELFALYECGPVLRDAAYSGRLAVLSRCRRWGAHLDLNNDGWKDLFCLGPGDGQCRVVQRRKFRQPDQCRNLGEGLLPARGRRPGESRERIAAARGFRQRWACRYCGDQPRRAGRATP
jgi:hypothetical protein